LFVLFQIGRATVQDRHGTLCKWSVL
jgi:hypothetical protein